MGKINSKISKLLNYYLNAFKEKPISWQYSFDNLLIGNEETQIAKHYFLRNNNQDLLYGSDLKNYQKKLSQYIGIDESDILLFYTAHAGLFFLLYQLRSLNPNRNKVVVPGFTCTVVTNAITSTGLKPIFVDIELETYSIDILSLEVILKNNNKEILAVIIQHLFGLVAKNYEQIVNLCKSYNIVVIGDCAPSLGTLYKGKSIGLLEDFALFSSQSSKSINTYTGGILLVNKEIKNIYENYEKLNFPDIIDIRHILKAYYLQFMKKVINKWYFPLFIRKNKGNFISSLHPSEIMDNRSVGLQAPILEGNKVYLRRFPNILAKIGLLQLSKLESFIKIRSKSKDYILKNFESTLTIIPHSRPSFIRIPVMKNEEYKKKVTYEKNCLVGNWFPYYFGDCPNSKEAAKRLVNYAKVENYEDIK